MAHPKKCCFCRAPKVNNKQDKFGRRLSEYRCGTGYYPKGEYWIRSKYCERNKRDVAETLKPENRKRREQLENDWAESSF